MGGYQNNPLQENIHQVSFSGNAYTSRGRTSDFALLRAAEIATTEGCPYFTVVEKQSGDRVSSYTTPQFAQTSGNIDSFGYLNTTTTVGGGQTHTVVKPGSRMLIKVLKERPADENVMVFNAVEIQQNLRAKYGIDESDQD